MTVNALFKLIANRILTWMGLKVLPLETYNYLGNFFDLAALKRWSMSNASPELKNFILSNINFSNSQIQQDLLAVYILERIQPIKASPTFIEFGACDGVQLSNSLLIEARLQGRGVLLEPSSKWFKQLEKNRAAICLQRVVTDESGKMVDLFLNKDPFLSTTKTDYSQQVDVDVETVETISLEDVFGLLDTTHVDYLSIDTEGNEFEIISAINLDIFSSKIITIEHNYSSNRQKIHEILTPKGYSRILESVSTFEDWYINQDYVKLELVTAT
jgi:FkbM family methyltransferase